jgi:hypothetical protein
MPTPLPHIALSRDASVFLDMIVEMGHLDEAGLDALNDMLLDAPSDAQGFVALQTVRAAVAMVLVDTQSRMPREAQKTLDVEWSLLLH